MKTFYAKTMAEAMEQAKAELGSDALLLSTRRIPDGTANPGRASGYEVVAAMDDSAAPGRSDAAPDGRERGPDRRVPSDAAVDRYTPSGLACTQAPAPALRRPSLRIPSLRKRRDPAEETAPQDLPFKDAASIGLYRELTASGVHDWLARKVIVGARELLPSRQRRSRSTLLRSASQVAQELIPSSSGNALPLRRIVIFVGPTGVGKTTSVAKLAAKLAIEHRKKVLLVTLDGHRIGAVEQLKTYAGLMGIPFRFVEHAEGLSRIIQDNAKKDFILVDTAGRAPNDLAPMREIAEFISGSDTIERHLVVSATTKPADLREIIDRFEICRPHHLVFTKLDETTTPGPILNELVRTGKPLSFYSDGQRVPDDFHAFSSDQAMEIVLQKS